MLHNRALTTALAALGMGTIVQAAPYYSGGYFNTSAPSATSSSSSSSLSSSCSTDVTLTSTSSVTVYSSSASGTETSSTASAAYSPVATPYITGEYENGSPVWSIYIPEYAFPGFDGFSVETIGHTSGFEFLSGSLSLFAGSLNSFTDISSLLSTDFSDGSFTGSYSGSTNDNYLKIVIKGTVSDENTKSFVSTFGLYIDVDDSAIQKRSTLYYEFTNTVTVPGIVTTNTYLSCSGDNCETLTSTQYVTAAASTTDESMETVYTTTISGSETVVTSFIPLTDSDETTTTYTNEDVTATTTVICHKTVCETKVYPVSSSTVYTTVVNGETQIVTSYIPITAAATGVTSGVGGSSPVTSEPVTTVTTVGSNGKTTVYTTVCTECEHKKTASSSAPVSYSTVTTTDENGATTTYVTTCPYSETVVTETGSATKTGGENEGSETEGATENNKATSYTVSTVTSVSNGATTICTTTCPLSSATGAASKGNGEASGEEGGESSGETATEGSRETTTEGSTQSNGEATVELASSSVVSIPAESVVSASKIVYTTSTNGVAATLTTYYTPISETSGSSSSSHATSEVPAVSVLSANAAATKMLNAGAIGFALGAAFLL